MSLYRQAGRRPAAPIVAALAVGLLAGALGGYLLGKDGGDDPPSLQAALADLSDRAQPVSAALELLPLEYGQAVRGGRAVEPTELAAARADLERARAVFGELRPELALLDRSGARRLEGGISALETLVSDQAPAARVEAAARAASRQLAAITGER
jgi:hypothetical protein